MGKGKGKIKSILSAVLSVFLGLPGSAAAQEDLNDAQKKEIVYGMYSEYKKEFPQVEDIGPPEAMVLFKKGRVVFVDTRKPAEMKVSMLPQAISKETFLKNPQRHKGRVVVVYCTISFRSGKFAEEMAEKGVKVVNLKGGILAWTLEGGKVYNQKGEVKAVHVYVEKWNYAPEGYKTVKFSLLERVI